MNVSHVFSKPGQAIIGCGIGLFVVSRLDLKGGGSTGGTAGGAARVGDVSWREGDDLPSVGPDGARQRDWADAFVTGYDLDENGTLDGSDRDGIADEYGDRYGTLVANAIARYDRNSSDALEPAESAKIGAELATKRGVLTPGLSEQLRSAIRAGTPIERSAP